MSTVLPSRPPAATATDGAPRTVVPADGHRFNSRQIVPLRHRFDTHPAMQLPALREVARRLHPQGQCRFIRPGSTVASAFWHDPQAPDGRDIDAVFDRIEEPGSWIALYNVETDPSCRAFLDEVIGAVRPMVEPEQPGLFNVTGFVFVSAPPSVTPFHIDRENNVWLQLRGRKSISVWDPSDREAVDARAVEAFIAHRDLSRVTLRDGLVERAHRFDVGAGDGVYWPATSPHMSVTDRAWCTPGDGVSISIGVCFYTASTRRDARVHQWNRILRRIGLDPVSPGLSSWRDAIKAPLGAAAVAVQHRLSGYQPPPGAA
jgi:hypothetical protein